MHMTFSEVSQRATIDGQLGRAATAGRGSNDRGHRAQNRLRRVRFNHRRVARMIRDRGDERRLRHARQPGAATIMIHQLRE